MNGAIAVVVLVLLAAVAGYLLSFVARKLAAVADPTVTAIDALLPQTQCGQCGYPGCRPYAEAIAADAAPINRCPPGGEACVAALAALLNREILPLDADCGEVKPPQLAWIDEPICIGCTKCIQACPVDAIIGAPKLTHTVIAELCTGCELCLPPCPVDCIELVPKPADPRFVRPPHPLLDGLRVRVA